MDGNHQDKTESILIATEDIRWEVNRKSKLWVPKHKKRTGFEGKTLWDWLQLLGVPIFLAFATIGFGFVQFYLAGQQHLQDQNLAQQQHDSDQRIANQQHAIDQQNALDQQHATLLQTYIDNIQDLLLHNNLLKSSSLETKNAYYDVAILARARTLTALQGLDQDRKGRLVQFLGEAQLIGFTDIKVSPLQLHDPIIILSGADLSDVNLNGAVLNGADLSDVDLSYAHLSYAILIYAHLSYAYLIKADLSHAVFIGADLSGADLHGASLIDVNLSGAHLTQQQLDQVYSCVGATLPKGLICNKNQ